MLDNNESWDKSVPADLISAIEHLRKLFDDAHWRCGGTTQVLCYWLLHDQVVHEPAKKFADNILYIKKIVGLSAARLFDNLIKEGTPPAIFKAFFDLYLEAMSVQAVLVFTELAAIGRANEERLRTSYLEWAETQTKLLIRSETHGIKNWVREVCDKQVYNPHEDPDELIFWRKWQAPRLIAMTPSKSRPYEAARIWERYDTDTSARCLETFAAEYIVHLEIRLEKVAGQALLDLAKRPKPVQLSELENVSRDNGVAKKDGRNTPNNVRREARKLNTQARYASWNREYRRLIKRRPDASDVWCSEKIAGMEIAEDSSAETIRKHMKK